MRSWVVYSLETRLTQLYACEILVRKANYNGLLGHSNKMFSFCSVASRIVIRAGGLLLYKTCSAFEVLLTYGKCISGVSKVQEVIYCTAAR